MTLLLEPPREPWRYPQYFQMTRAQFLKCWDWVKRNPIPGGYDDMQPKLTKYEFRP